MKIGIGADPFGIGLKETVKEHLESKGHECVDLGGAAGEDRSYYDVAHELGGRIASGEIERGVLVCGTGMGMAIIANKHPGVYAAVCEDASSAAKARSINNANVLTLGELVTAPFRAREIVDAFLDTEFKSGWDADTRSFLDRSMVDIDRLERETFGRESD
jgi:ribose 5-phosphate isomerase B